MGRTVYAIRVMAQRKKITLQASGMGNHHHHHIHQVLGQVACYDFTSSF
jgi:hypothetical protein